MGNPRASHPLYETLCMFVGIKPYSNCPKNVFMVWIAIEDKVPIPKCIRFKPSTVVYRILISVFTDYRS